MNPSHTARTISTGPAIALRRRGGPFLVLIAMSLAASACRPAEVLPSEPGSLSMGTERADSDRIFGIEFTPPQQEGPYYPLEKPADRDNDLVDFAGATGPPGGEVLVFSGVVYDAQGRPVEGAIVEIWQADHNGVYLHPDDPDVNQRDTNFQSYGEAVTAADGVYSFRTILPGLYGTRPRHIHFKVWLDGQELLTSQFYFGSEVPLGGAEANLLVEIAPAEDDAGRPIWVGARDLVLNIDPQ